MSRRKRGVMPKEKTEKPVPKPCVCGRGGVHRGEQRQEDDFLPGSRQLPRQSADPVA